MKWIPRLAVIILGTLFLPLLGCVRAGFDQQANGNHDRRLPLADAPRTDRAWGGPDFPAAGFDLRRCDSSPGGQNDMGTCQDAPDKPALAVKPAVGSGTGELSKLDVDCYQVHLRAGETIHATLLEVVASDAIWFFDFMLPSPGGPYDGTHSSWGWNGPLPYTRTDQVSKEDDYALCICRDYCWGIGTPCNGSACTAKYQLQIKIE